MLTSQLAAIKPSNFAQDTKEAASEAGGITDGWFEFETGVARGYGHIRLKDGLIWTLLTTMTELKGHEEPKGNRRPMGPNTAMTVTVGPGKKSGKRKRPNWAIPPSPMSSSLAAVRAALRSVRVYASSVYQRSSLRRMNGPATAGVSATSRSACTIPSGTITCPTSPSRKTGQSSRRRTKWVTGWKCIPG